MNGGGDGGDGDEDITEDTPYLLSPNALVRQRKQWQGSISMNPLNDNNNNNSNMDDHDDHGRPRFAHQSSELSEEENDERLAQLLKSIDDAHDNHEDGNDHHHHEEEEDEARQNVDSRDNIPCSNNNSKKLESENAQLKGKLQAERDEWQENNDIWMQQMNELESEILRLHESGKTERDLWKREKQQLQQQQNNSNEHSTDLNNTINSNNNDNAGLLRDLKQISEEAIRLEEELHAVTEDRDELLRKQTSTDHTTRDSFPNIMKQHVFSNLTGIYVDRIILAISNEKRIERLREKKTSVNDKNGSGNTVDGPRGIII